MYNNVSSSLKAKKPKKKKVVSVTFFDGEEVTVSLSMLGVKSIQVNDNGWVTIEHDNGISQTFLEVKSFKTMEVE